MKLNIRISATCFTLAILLSCGGIFAAIPDSLDQLIRVNPNRALFQLKSNTRLHKVPEFQFNLASVYEKLGKYYQADSLLEIIKDGSWIKSDTLNELNYNLLNAENKKVLDQFEEALGSINFALNYFEKRGNGKGLIETYILLGEYYRATENFKVAIDYLHRASTMGESLAGGFPIPLKTNMYNRKAAVYLQQGIYLDSVEWFSKEVIRLATQFNDQDQVATSCNELGFLYLNINNPLAEFYFLKAIGIWEKMGYFSYAMNAKLNLGRYYLKEGKNKEAIQLGEASLKSVRSNGWTWDEGYWLELLYHGYAKTGNFQLAYTYAESAKEIFLANARHQYNDRLAYYSNKLELKEKEEEINEKNKEVINAYLELSAKEGENKLLFYLLLFTAISLLATISGMLIFLKQKKLLKEQRLNIAQSNVQLETLISQKEILLKEINHRVKNNLGLLSGLMYLKQKDLVNTEAIQAMQDMQGRINAISLVHETLYQSLDLKTIHFNEYLDTLGKQIIGIVSGMKQVYFSVDCGNFKPDFIQLVPLAMIINEMITNSLKHAFASVSKPVIHISYHAEENALIYKDNGPGFSPEGDISSLGRNLIHIFAKQIHAHIQFFHDGEFMVIKLVLKSSNK